MGAQKKQETGSVTFTPFCVQFYASFAHTQTPKPTFSSTTTTLEFVSMSVAAERMFTPPASPPPPDVQVFYSFVGTLVFHDPCTQFTSVSEYVHSLGGNKVIDTILIANNGIAAGIESESKVVVSSRF